MKRLALILATVALLSLPAGASAHAANTRHHARHAIHTLRHHRAHKSDAEEDEALPWEEEVLEGDTETDGSESCTPVPGPCTVVES